MSPPTIILAGAGHAHLYVAARVRELMAVGSRVYLIDPGRFWYSGLATGMLGGTYEPDDDQIDPKALIEGAGGEFIPGRIAAIDPGNRTISLADGQSLRYDYLSINTGSQVNTQVIPGLIGSADVFPVKPVSNLWRLRQHMQAELRAGRKPRVVVIGGGPTGAEVAANVAGLCARQGTETPIILVTRSKRLVAQMPLGASRAVARNLSKRGVELRFNTHVAQRAGNVVITTDGQRIPADVVVPAIGLEASALVQATGLPSSQRDGLRVNARLHSVADERVFAAGDCACMDDYNLPKLGVFGVRQASIIHANLLASLNAGPLQKYTPQKRYLAILNLGDGTGVATWGPLWWAGRASMKLKDFIDRRFIDGYRRRYQDIQK